MSDRSFNGHCPVCDRAADRVYNIGRSHWCVCDEHRLKWCLGSNLFSGWQRESPGDWVANELRLGEYEAVDIRETL